MNKSHTRLQNKATYAYAFPTRASFFFFCTPRFIVDFDTSVTQNRKNVNRSFTMFVNKTAVLLASVYEAGARQIRYSWEKLECILWQCIRFMSGGVLPMQLRFVVGDKVAKWIEQQPTRRHMHVKIANSAKSGINSVRSRERKREVAHNPASVLQSSLHTRAESIEKFHVREPKHSDE